jgi:hypothetical protein
MCDLYCHEGYEIDEKGCPMCKCKQIACGLIYCPYEAQCTYGISVDTRTRCPTCDCNPCPQVRCSRYCPHGYQLDPKTGCPTCLCNEKPICPLGIETDNTFRCSLKCEKGYVYENGCPQCRCNEVQPCICSDPKPDLTRREPCLDGKTYEGYTGVCIRSTDGKVCAWEKTRCPIGISVTIPAGSSLTDAEIEKIRLSLSLNEKDFFYTKVQNADGSITYVFFSNRDGLPTTIDDPTKVNNEVSSTVKESHPNAVSMIYAGDHSSFAKILVPIMGFLVILFI